MQAHYDDPKFSYTEYWQGREYEHQAEVIALENLIAKEKFIEVADIGGGYGRLTNWLASHAQKIYLIEPSEKQLMIGKEFLKHHKNVQFIKATSEHTKLASQSIELIVMVRVSHHLPNIIPTLDELTRILKPNAQLIIEVANSVNMKSRIMNWIKGTRVQLTPVERRSLANIRKQTIPFVNHHPQYIEDQLKKRGFVIQRKLSVSNFRHKVFKKYLPRKTLLALENFTQPLLSRINFGPSIFILAKASSGKLDFKTNP